MTVPVPHIGSGDGGALGAAVAALWELTLVLRANCPWDEAQTAGTMLPHTLEDAWEVADVVRVATNVFSAGQETTVRLLSTALKVMGDQPDIQRRLREDRSLLGNFIEECLRIESPVKGDFRLSRVPTTVGEQEIGAGCTLMVINGAANRDPRRFEDPDTFDPDRKNARQHLAFGRGIHSCPGAPLARAETRVGLERLLDRTTDIRISEKHHGPASSRRYQYIPTYILRGLTQLHIEFDVR